MLSRENPRHESYNLSVDGPRTGGNKIYFQTDDTRWSKHVEIEQNANFVSDTRRKILSILPIELRYQFRPLNGIITAEFKF